MSPAPAAPRSWTAIVNPAAGRGRARALVPAVADALASAPIDVAVVVSSGPDDLVARARRAFTDGRGVVACGGDGTVSALAGVAADCGGVLAVVPTGSGNDFARQLGIPRDDPTAAVALLAAPTVTTVDLGRATVADGTMAWFTTVANAGFDAEANRWANEVDRVSGTPLYVLATLRTLAHYKPRPFRVVVDGEVLDTDAWLVAVGNTRTYASGMMITPAAELDDGRLDVCVVGPVSRADFLRTFPKVFSGRHVDHPAVRTRCGAVIDVEARGPAAATMELWAGGERVGPLPARLEAVPQALRVVVPAPARDRADAPRATSP